MCVCTSFCCLTFGALALISFLLCGALCGLVDPFVPMPNHNHQDELSILVSIDDEVLSGLLHVDNDQLLLTWDLLSFAENHLVH